MAKFRKAIAFVLTLTLCFSMVQLTALSANGDSTESQIMDGWYEPDATSKTVTDDATDQEWNQIENGAVRVSKTIAGTGTENVFNVTLQVETTQAFHEEVTNPDAAVVLVIDHSGSMQACAECGRPQEQIKVGNGSVWRYMHAESCKYYNENDKHKAVDYAQSRMAAVNASAISFLNNLRNSVYDKESGTYIAHRYVAVVPFSSTAVNQTLAGSYYWADITTYEGYHSVYNAINDNSTANGATNLSNAFDTAESRLTMKNPWVINGSTQYGSVKAEQIDISGLEHKYTVALTDGAPTRYGYYGTRGTGDSTDRDTYNATVTSAINLKKVCTLLSICFGAANDKLSPYDSNLSVSGFLTNISNASYSASDANGLEIAFGSVAKLIEMLAEAWTVYDPMGTYVEYVSDNGTSTKYDQDTKQLVWDLKNDASYVENTKETAEGNSTTYTYTLTYQVKLNNLDKDFDTNVFYPTNGYTYLTYVLYNQDNQIIDENGQVVTNPPEDGYSIPFNIPAVKGYKGELSFTKVGPDGKAPLEGASFTLTTENGKWTANVASDQSGKVDFTNIPSGHTYTLKEIAAPEGYAVSDDEYTVVVSYGNVTVKKGDEEVNLNGRTITNYYKVQTTSLEITKDWLAPEGTTHPGSIDVKIVQYDAHGQKTGVEKSVTIAGDAIAKSWTQTISDLVTRDENGSTYTYKVEEVEPEGWNSKADRNEDGSWTIKNIITDETSVTVRKDWILPEGVTAPEVTVTLIGNGGTAGCCNLNADNEWTQTFAELPMYDAAGQLITYTVSETVPDGYQFVKQYTDTDGTIVIVNTVNQVTDYSVSGSKTWNDNNNADNTRPDSIEVELLQDGQSMSPARTVVVKPDAEGNWSYSFDNLDKYEFTLGADDKIASVHEYKYTVKEVSVDGYTSTVDGYNITNTRTGTTSLTVEKNWVLLNSTDLPGSVTVNLLRNGVKVDGQSVELNASNSWTGTFENLAKYDENGSEYTYTVSEAIVEGFAVDYKYDDGKAIITNTDLGVDGNETVNVFISKIWKQPANVEAQTATFTVTGSDGSTHTVDITGNGMAFVQNLPRYQTITDSVPVEMPTEGEDVDSETGSDPDANIPEGETDTLDADTPAEGGTDEVMTVSTVTRKVPIEYIVTEQVPDGYSSKQTNYKVANNGNVYYEFENTIYGLTTITVNKTWVHPDGTETPDITFNVLRNGEKLDYLTITLKDGATSGSISVDKYDENGQLYTYTLEENAPAGYSSTVTGGVQSDGSFVFNVTNSINQQNTSFNVQKVWVDGGLPDSARPNVTITLLQDGKDYESVTLGGETIDKVDANTWSYTFEDLPVYTDDLSAKHVYTVEEAAVEMPEGSYCSYTSSISESGHVVTNTRVGDIIVQATKVWLAPVGYKLPAITLDLTATAAGGYSKTYKVVVNSETATMTEGGNYEVKLSVSDDGFIWSIDIPGMPHFTSDGSVISYQFDEEPVEGFELVQRGYPGFFVNQIKQEEVSVSATKNWVTTHTNRHEPEVPGSINVGLFRNSALVETEEVKADSDGNWNVTFENLDKYSSISQEYKYEIFELDANNGKLEDGDTVTYGDSEYKVSYGTGEDGSTVITNTYVEPQEYFYRVTTTYLHYNSDGQLIDYYYQVGAVMPTKQGVVSVTAGDYAEHNSLIYDLDDTAENVLSVNVEEANRIYDLVLNYILRDPTPDPEPEEPENPDPGPGPGPGPGTNPDPDPQPTPTPEPDPEPDVPPVEIPDDDTPTTDEPDTPPVDIPDDDTPTTDLPDEDTPTTDLPDEDTPTTDLPDEEPPLANIPDDDVPMDEAPKTGDESLMMLWGIVMMMSGLGLTILSATKPRRRGKHCK